MHRRLEVALVYLAGLVQGLGLVTYPATSAVLTDPGFHGLSGSEYGSLFLPMIVTAVLASTASGPLARRWTARRVFLVGLAANTISMALFAATAVVLPGNAYPWLVGAMGALGLGFGFTVAIVNVFATGFFPRSSDTALTALHAVLGTGTALAPLIGGVWLAPERWWILPSGVAAAALGLLAWGFARPLRHTGTYPEASAPEPGELVAAHALPRERIPPFLWGFALAVALYGVAESLFANWATLYVSGTAALSPDVAGLALAVFWAMLTVGRIVASLLSRRVPSHVIYRVLPVSIAVALVAVPRLEGATGVVTAFGLAGLACSAFLPLSISLASDLRPDLGALISGTLMATYLLGFGIAAFAPGPLVDRLGVSLATVFTAASTVAVLLAVVAFRVVRYRVVTGRESAGETS